MAGTGLIEIAERVAGHLATRVPKEAAGTATRTLAKAPEKTNVLENLLGVASSLMIPGTSGLRLISKEVTGQKFDGPIDTTVTKVGAVKDAAWGLRLLGVTGAGTVEEGAGVIVGPYVLGPVAAFGLLAFVQEKLANFSPAQASATNAIINWALDPLRQMAAPILHNAICNSQLPPQITMRLAALANNLSVTGPELQITRGIHTAHDVARLLREKSSAGDAVRAALQNQMQNLHVSPRAYAERLDVYASVLGSFPYPTDSYNALKAPAKYASDLQTFVIGKLLTDPRHPHDIRGPISISASELPTLPSSSRRSAASPVSTNRRSGNAARPSVSSMPRPVHPRPSSQPTARVAPSTARRVQTAHL